MEPPAEPTKHHRRTGRRRTWPHFKDLSPADILERRRVAGELARRLHEPEVGALGRVVLLIGPEQATALAEQALTLQRKGGVLTRRGDRLRTTGGCFFSLLGTVLTERWQWLYVKLGASQYRKQRRGDRAPLDSSSLSPGTK